MRHSVPTANLMMAISLSIFAGGCELFDGKPTISDKDLVYTSYEQVRAVMADEDASVALVDARPPESFNEAHLPGAINIPSYNMKRDDPRLADAGAIIVYDSKAVPVGRGSAKRLLTQGYTNVRTYVYGLDDWSKHGGRLVNARGEEVTRDGDG